MGIVFCCDAVVFCWIRNCYGCVVVAIVLPEQYEP
jgi:hypothetical protein